MAHFDPINSELEIVFLPKLSVLYRGLLAIQLWPIITISSISLLVLTSVFVEHMLAAENSNPSWIALAPAFFMLLLFPTTTWLGARKLLASKAFSGPIIYRFGEHEMEVHTTGAQSRFDYKLLGRHLERFGILLIKVENTHYFVPMDAVEATKLTQLRMLLQKTIQKP